MLVSAISGILTIAAVTLANPTPQHWKIVGYKSGQEVPLNDAISLVVSSYSEEGPGLVLLCNESIGLLSFIAYQPTDDLSDQIQGKQKMSGNKIGTMTINGQSYQDRWVHKDRIKVLQARDKKISFALLNAIFNDQTAEFNFSRMDPMSLNFPEVDENLQDFVDLCPITRKKST